uniref:Gamma-tubulin complex component n=1 Tax=Steinernema glaseri TaxID=37863 RepID=A0A1I8AVR9_9BILA
MALESSDDEYIVPALGGTKELIRNRRKSSDDEWFLIASEEHRTAQDMFSCNTPSSTSIPSSSVHTVAVVELPAPPPPPQIISFDQVLSEIFSFVIPGHACSLITAGKRGTYIFSSTATYDRRRDDPHFLRLLLKRLEYFRKMFVGLWDFCSRTDLIETAKPFQHALFDLLNATIEELDIMKRCTRFNGLSSVLIRLQRHHDRLILPYKVCSQFHYGYYFDDYSLDQLHENVLRETKDSFMFTEDKVLREFLLRVSDDFLRTILSYIDWLFETQRMSKISGTTETKIVPPNVVWNYNTFSSLVSFPILWTADLRHSLGKASRAIDALRNLKILSRRESLTPFSNFFRHHRKEAGLEDQMLDRDEITLILERSAADCAYQYDNRLFRVILEQNDLQQILCEYRQIFSFSIVPQYFLAMLKLSRNKVVLDKKLREILQLYGLSSERAKRWHVEVPEDGNLAQIKPVLANPLDGILPDCFWHTSNMGLSLLFTIYYAHVQLVGVLQEGAYEGQKTHDVLVRVRKFRFAAFMNMRLCSALFDCLSNYVSTVIKTYSEKILSSETISEVMVFVKQLDTHVKVISLTDTDSRKLFHATVKAVCSTAKKLTNAANTEHGLPDEASLESLIKVLSRCRETFVGFSKMVDHPVYESLAARISGQRRF